MQHHLDMDCKVCA